MDKDKSAKLLIVASILMIIAATIFMFLNIFAEDAHSRTMSIIFFLCAVSLFGAWVNFKKSGDK